MGAEKNTVVFDLLSRITAVSTSIDEDGLVSQLQVADKPVIVSFVNAHAVNMAVRLPIFFRNLSGSDVLLRDGIGVKAMMKVLGLAPGLNMNGTDFIPKFLDFFAGKRFAIYGTAEPWLSSSVAIAQKKVHVVDFADGFQEQDFYLQRVKLHLPDVVVLGMGMPKQESLATAIRAACNHPCIVINGGAILDFMSNRFPRAPQWMRTLSLEWFFRFVQEPRRLFGRYVTGGVESLLLLFVCLLYRFGLIKTD